MFVSIGHIICHGGDSCGGVMEDMLQKKSKEFWWHRNMFRFFCDRVSMHLIGGSNVVRENGIEYPS